MIAISEEVKTNLIGKETRHYNYKSDTLYHGKVVDVVSDLGYPVIIVRWNDDAPYEGQTLAYSLLKNEWYEIADDFNFIVIDRV